jgi:hypothetical protein
MDQRYISASIVVGQSQSNAIILNGQPVVGLMASASNVSASTVTFLVSTDAVNFYPLYNNASAEYSVMSGSAANTAIRGYAVDPTSFRAWKAIKLRLGNSASAINQTTSNALFTVVAANV